MKLKSLKSMPLSMPILFQMFLWSQPITTGMLLLKTWLSKQPFKLRLQSIRLKYQPNLLN